MKVAVASILHSDFCGTNINTLAEQCGRKLNKKRINIKITHLKSGDIECIKESLSLMQQQQRFLCCTHGLA